MCEAGYVVPIKQLRQTTMRLTAAMGAFVRTFACMSCCTISLIVF
jgi:hypothetical protein